jgi:ATP-binding cassette subfamily B protein
LEDSGTLILNQGKDIVVTFIVVKLVIDGRLTIGAMFAIQYILGQLSNPIELFLRFVQSAQDAKISMGRLNEIHKIESEESVSKGYIRRLPADRTILIRDLGFAFPAEKSRRVLNNIDLQIPEGKVTAIVGTSGSGKTTLLKLLLKYYQDYDGQICIGDTDLKALSPSFWRGCCGAVLQDGFIFNDTITGNISLGKEPVDHLRIIEACRLANILSFIQSLPDGLNTLLGVGGTGISQGQRQRILIARVIYKDPEYLFFDEFTNALDANSERIIVENLQHVFRKKTVVIVAHRLSTVKNADNIIVMHEGRILEQGDHNELIRFNGGYLELIKNQLDIRR